MFFFLWVAHWDNQLLTAGGRGEATEGKGTVVRANSRPQTNIQVTPLTMAILSSVDQQ